MKYRAAIKVVTTLIGISNVKSDLHKVSVTSKKVAPNANKAGIKYLLSGPARLPVM